MSTNSTVLSNTSSTNGIVLSDGAYLAIGLYMSALGISSFFMNLFVIIVLMKGKPKFHAIHNALLLNIATSDLLLSAIAYPFNTVAGFSKRWVFPDAACEFVGFWVFALAQNNMNTLAAISLCRYVIVCKPQYEYYLKKKSTIYIIFATVWGHALFVTTPPLLGWNRYTTEAYGVSCTIDWIDRSPSVLAYKCVIICICYVFHVGIFVFCYTNILKSFSSASQHEKPRKNSQTDDRVFHIALMAWKYKMAASKMVSMASLAMVASFLISWTPYAFSAMYVMAAGPEDSPVWVLVIPTMFAKSSTLLTPVVCSIMSSNFREAFLKMVGRHNKVNPVGIETEEQRCQPDHSRPKCAITKYGIYVGED